MSASQDHALEETTDDLASFDFAPWPARPSGWRPPTNDEWIALANPHLVSVRLAWLTCNSLGMGWSGWRATSEMSR